MEGAYVSNRDDLGNDTSKSDSHHWNRRENKKNIKWYVVLIAICGLIAWILSSMGYE